MEIRPLTAELKEPLQPFFRRVPEPDHNRFAQDVIGRGAVEGWLRDTRGRRMVALDGDQVLGYLAVLPLVGWSAHVASLRVVVGPEARGKGAARKPARQGLLTSLEMGLTKTVVEVVV